MWDITSVRPECRATGDLSTFDHDAALKLRLTRLSRSLAFLAFLGFVVPSAGDAVEGAGDANASVPGGLRSSAVTMLGSPPANTVPAKRPAANRELTARLQAVRPALRWSLIILVPPVTSRRLGSIRIARPHGRSNRRLRYYRQTHSNRLSSPRLRCGIKVRRQMFPAWGFRQL